MRIASKFADKIHEGRLPNWEGAVGLPTEILVRTQASPVNRSKAGGTTPSGLLQLLKQCSRQVAESPEPST